MRVENKTIIITDPCYIIPKNPNPFPFKKEIVESPNSEEMKKAYYDWEREHNDWEKCNYGSNMEALGIIHYICRDTIYGDWSCATYNTDTKECIGEFCADAGLVAVFILDEVRAYNPNIDKWIEDHPWGATVIENFTGDVDFEIVHTEGVYTKEDEHESNGKIYCKAGETWENDEVQVIGKGNINFFTTQTGL